MPQERAAGRCINTATNAAIPPGTGVWRAPAPPLGANLPLVQALALVAMMTLSRHPRVAIQRPMISSVRPHVSAQGGTGSGDRAAISATVGASVGAQQQRRLHAKIKLCLLTELGGVKEVAACMW